MNAEGPISPQVLAELFLGFQNLLTRFTFDFPQSIVREQNKALGERNLARLPGAF
jgi:hypothetical protein